MVISLKLIEDQTKTENSDQKSFEEGKITLCFYFTFLFLNCFVLVPISVYKTRTSPLVLFSADYYSALYGMVSDFPQCGIFSKLSHIPMHCL